MNGESPRIHVITAESSKNRSKNQDEEVCLTPGCVHAASKMLDHMDESIEPCDDFYNFACGQYVEDTIIPDDKVSVNAFSVISDKLQEQLRTIITAPVEDDEIEPFKMVKKLYIACMNKSKLNSTISDSSFSPCNKIFPGLIEERGLTPLLEIHESMGGWPVVKGDSWDEKSWTWQQSVRDFRKRGYSTDYIFDFSVGTDLKNSTRRIIDVSENKL